MAKGKEEWVPSVLGHAILQLLSRNTASGYDLKKRFHSSVGHGWHAYDTQIYRELRSLEENGYVVGETAKGVGGPQRRLYSITEKGSDSIVRWLTSPVDVGKIKDEFALRTWTADLFPGETFADYVSTARDQWAEELVHIKMSLRILTEEYGPETESPDHVVGRQLAIKFSQALTEAKIQWADQTLKSMRRRWANLQKSAESAV